MGTKGVEKARRDVVEIIESFPVWDKIPRHKMPKGTKTIDMRWVDVTKQDEENPFYRSRLVAQEVKKGSGFDVFFAAMPSLPALKMLVRSSHVPVATCWNGGQRGLREAKTFRLSGCETRSFETWRRCSWKIAQIALRNTRRTSELGVADSESDDCFKSNP